MPRVHDAEKVGVVLALVRSWPVLVVGGGHEHAVQPDSHVEQPRPQHPAQNPIPLAGRHDHSVAAASRSQRPVERRGVAGAGGLFVGHRTEVFNGDDLAIREAARDQQGQQRHRPAPAGRHIGALFLGADGVRPL